MSVSRFLLALALTFELGAIAAPSSLGPTSPQEAALLWKEGQAAFEARDFQRAVSLLQRFVDRYPGHSGYLEAHRVLGESYLGLAESQAESGGAAQARASSLEALTPLRHYAAGTREVIRAAQGKLLLGQAYLATGKLQESLLSALEVEKLPFKPGPEAEPLQIEALLLKAMSQLALKRHKDAERALASAEERLGKAKPATPSDPLPGKVALARLQFKAAQCARLPAPGKMDEAQARDQISRRGDCLLQALQIYKAALETGHELSMKKATRETLAAFESFRRACLNPPEPRPLKPLDRTALERKRYRDELVQGLSQECLTRRRAGVETLLGWKTEEKITPPAFALAESIARSLEKK